MTTSADAHVKELLDACDAVADRTELTLVVTRALAESLLFEVRPSDEDLHGYIGQVEASRAELSRFRTIVARHRREFEAQ